MVQPIYRMYYEENKLKTAIFLKYNILCLEKVSSSCKMQFCATLQKCNIIDDIDELIFFKTIVMIKYN